MGEEVIFVRKATGLVREVGWFTAMSMALCHTIGGGINFFSVKAMATSTYYTANIPLGYAIAGIPVVCLAIALSLMAVAMPRTGGDYIYVSRVLNPFIGFLSNWMFWWCDALVYGLIAYLDVWFWGLSFWVFGKVFGVASMVSLGTWMQSGMACLMLGILLDVIWYIIGLLGTKPLGYVMNFTMIIPLISGILLIIALFGWPAWVASPQAAWDKLFGEGAYSRIIDIARANGWSEELYWPGHAGFSPGPTFNVMVPATWAYIGATSGIYIGSEVKTPTKSMLAGSAFAAIFIMIYYVLLTYGVYSAFGPFIQAYNFAMKDPDAVASVLGAPFAPMLPLFATVLAPHPIIGFLISIHGAFWLMNDIPAFQFVCSRAIFAWSFDRFFPEFLAAVNDRFHSPHWALTVVLIIGVIGVVLTHVNPWFAMGATTNMFMWRAIFACLTGILYPFARPDIFERGLKVMLGPVPLVTLVSIIGLPFWIIGFAYTFLDYIGPGAGMAGLMWLLLVAILLAVGSMIFIAYWAYNVKRGISVKELYTEIPPA